MITKRTLHYLVFIGLPPALLIHLWFWWLRLGLDPLPLVAGSFIIGTNLITGLLMTKPFNRAAITIWLLNYIVILILYTIWRDLFR